MHRETRVLGPRTRVAVAPKGRSCVFAACEVPDFARWGDLGKLPGKLLSFSHGRLFQIYCFSFFVAPVVWQFLILHERMTGYR